MGFDMQQFAQHLPVAAWFLSSVTSAQFWSGAESDDLVLHVASLLRSCIKIGRQDTEERPLVSEPIWLQRCSETLAIIQSCTHVAWLAGSGSSSSSSSKDGTGIICADSIAAGETGSSIVQLNSYTEPCPQPFLQLSGLLLTVLAQALAAVPYPAVEAAPGLSDVLLFQADILAVSLFQCLGFLHWAGGQLQQLVLPGDPAKAAAALQDLQEQQQQLQQALTVAVWRLNQTAAMVAGSQHTDEQQQQQQNAGSSSSTVGGSGDEGTPIMPARAPPSDLHAILASQPTGPLTLVELDPTRQPSVLLVASVTADLMGAQLPAQLQAFGSALWSALPQPRCCNNAGCTNLGSVSEAKLVAGKASRCIKCKVAK
jgi:hypothetical protein